MAGEQNLESAKRGYAAFAAGDAAGAMEFIADDAEWITPGNSSVSGIHHGKQEIGAFWQQLAENGFSVSPEYWFSDDDRVVVLNHISLGGGEADVADVLTFRDGKVVKFQTAGGEGLLEHAFGSR